VQVAGDLFNGSCTQPGGGTWTDGGYNAGTDTSCFASTPPASDTSASAVGSDLQTGPTGNGGPTQTIAPTAGNPAITLITNPATVTLGGSQVGLCPAVDQRGAASAAGAACDVGAVQTTGSPTTVTTTTAVAAPATGTTGTPIPASAISATLAGAATGAGGTITYTVFGPQAGPPSDCTSGGTPVGAPAAVSSNGTYHPSAGFTPPGAGTYWWYAGYAGASGNSPSTSGCGTGMTATTVTAPPAADLAVTNAGAPNPAVHGQPLTYTLKATNTGASPASLVRVKDRLPASLTFGSMAMTAGSCVRHTSTTLPATMGGTVVCTARQLAAGATMTVTIAVTPAKAGTLTDKATVSATGVIADTDDSATATVTVH
jgi:uncharacterized repeat protein (TIGR01451 family)